MSEHEQLEELAQLIAALDENDNADDDDATTLPDPPDGFVRVRHETLGATAVVPAVALAVHQARGWVVVDEQRTPTSADTTPADTTAPEATP